MPYGGEYHYSNYLKLSKREKTEITNIKNERENIITDLMDIRKT